MNEQQQRDHGVVHMIVYGCIIATFVLVVYGVFVNREITVHTNTMTADQVITVDGMAEAFVVPDTAKVSFGVTAKNRSTTVATQSVNERMQNLVDALEKTGVEKKDVKTISYTLSPEYTYTDNAQRFDGYRVSQRVEITIRDLDTASAVLDLVNSAGVVDDVSQLTFFVDAMKMLYVNSCVPMLLPMRDVRPRRLLGDFGCATGQRRVLTKIAVAMCRDHSMPPVCVRWMK